MSNIIFISSLIHPSFKEHVYYSIASENYQRNVVKAIAFKKIYSINAGNTTTRLIKNDLISYYVFSSTKLKLVKNLIKLGFTIKKSLSNSDVILFYNLTNRNIFVFAILRFVYKLKCFVIVADYNPPQVNLVSRIIHKCLSKASGIFALSPQLDIHENLVCQQLLISAGDINNRQKISLKNHILMSGSLGHTNGLTVAVNAMKFLPGYHLHLSGPLYDISLAELSAILNVAEKNITYHGLLSAVDYDELLHTCGICLSLRDPALVEHQFNFPSKIGEYLQAGKTVISSISYVGFGDVIHTTDWGPEALSQTILSISEEKIVAKDWLLSKFGLEKFRNNIDHIIANSKV